MGRIDGSGELMEGVVKKQWLRERERERERERCGLGFEVERLLRGRE